MLGRAWSEELWRLFLLFALLFIGGLLFGQVGWFLVFGLVLYLGWHLYNLYRLARWLRVKKLQTPEAPGLWGEIFQQFRRLQQRNRKRKRKLSNMLRRFRESTEAMPDAAVVLNAAYEIEWFNKAAARFLNLQFPKDLNRPITNLLRDPRFIQYLEHDCKNNGSAPSIKLPSPLDTQRILRIHVVPYARKSHLLIARDVSRLHRLEQTRRDFVANVSHELRTPLTVIHGFIETLQDDLDDCPQWQRPLLLMGQQAARMQNIVNDLLLLSRLEGEEIEGEGEAVDVPALLRDICADARALSGEQAHELCEEVDDSLFLCGREEELRSAFSNIVFNAVRYTPAHGKIFVRWYSDAEGAHFLVQDSGEGIARQHLPRLTERFYRVDVARSRGHGGTGLGLAIVKHVLNRHQAQLRIDSELGQGSVFCCDFPANLVFCSSEQEAALIFCRQRWQECKSNTP
jgi:two-component system, OmpR family, phosphate regulon sensor histidine kinase PhoR